LGRQASVHQWKRVIALFAANPGNLDLERMAGSTLGRQQEVVASVLDLLERKRGPNALFVAHAAQRLREEPHLVERAAAIEQALFEENLALLEEAEANPLQSLYVLLSLPLQAQR